MKNIYSAVIILLVVWSCATARKPATPQDAFIKEVSAFCGKQYGGKVVFPEGGRDPFTGKALVMYVENCSASQVRIPFWVGEDRSRTWVLTRQPEGLELKHDHRHEDGTPDSITMYGGTAREAGSALMQAFPADQYTANLIPRAATNEWVMQLSDDRKIFSYILKRDNQRVFQADFDLTQPLRQ
jgi:hypothetical protein